jgi:hypothetical protein
MSSIADVVSLSVSDSSFVNATFISNTPDLIDELLPKRRISIQIFFSELKM